MSPRGGDALSLAVPGLKDGAVYGAAGMWCFTFAVMQSRWLRRLAAPMMQILSCKKCKDIYDSLNSLLSLVNLPW